MSTTEPVLAGPTRKRRSFQYGLRTLIVAFSVTGLLMGLLLTPIVHIDQAACSRIRPGMTVAECEEIIGGPEGWYDGVGGISTDAPAWKGERPSWVGLKGELILLVEETDSTKRVKEAAFYPTIDLLGWSWSTFTLERLTRRHSGELESVDRVAGSLIMTVLALIAASGFRVPARGPNVLANHGGLGIILGSVVTGVFFWGYDVTIIYVLIGGASGAGLGLLVGVIRQIVVSRQDQRTGPGSETSAAMVRHAAGYD